MPSKIVCTADDLKTIRALVVEGQTRLTAREFQRLQVFERLCLGHRGKDIAEEIVPKVLPQTVSAAKKKLLKDDAVASTIRKFQTLIERRTAEQSTTSLPKKRGRLGFKTWNHFENSADVEVETVIEVASLFISPSIRRAVLAVRGPGSVRATLTSLGEHEPARWSHISWTDWLLEKTFVGLTVEVAKFSSENVAGELPELAAVRAQFTEGFSFFVLEESGSGSADRLGRLAQSSDGFTYLPFRGCETFMVRLENLLCRLRMRHSCIGFLPCLKPFVETCNGWINGRKDFGTPLIWSTSLAEATDWLRARKSVSTYLASAGYVYDLKPSVWRVLPFRDYFDWKAVKLRPRVEITSHNAEAGEIGLLVQPLPESGYPVAVLSNETPEKVARAFREMLRKNNPESRLIYAADPARKQLRYPKFLRAQEFENGDVNRAIDGTAVGLVPKHFLTPAPEIDLDTLAQIALVKNSSNDPFEQNGVDVESSLVTNVVLGLVEAIKEAFQLNRYGDAHRAAYFHQKRHQAAQSMTISARGQADPRRLDSLVRLNPHSGPYYFLSDDDLVMGPPPLDVYERLSHRAIVLNEKVKIGEPASENTRTPATDGGYSAECTFLAVLSEFDADFLLLGLSPSAWTMLASHAESWVEKIRRVLIDRYCPSEFGGKLNLPLVRAAIPFSSSLDDSALSDLFWDAIPGFCRGQSRVFLRSAVENAQRLVLAGRKPAGVVVRTHAAVLRSWRSYLGRWAKGRIADAGTRTATEKEILRQEAEAGDRGEKKNRRAMYEDFTDDLDARDDVQDLFEDDV